MKLFKVLFVLLLFGGFFSTNANAQAIVEKDRAWSYEGIIAYDSHDVVTPDGTVNLRINFMLPLDHPLVLEAILSGGKFTDTSTVYSWRFGTVICKVTVYANGRMNWNGHREP